MSLIYRYNLIYLIKALLHFMFVFTHDNKHLYVILQIFFSCIFFVESNNKTDFNPFRDVN